MTSCDKCIYGMVRTGDIYCTNRYVDALEHKPDPYECEFYDEKTDSYMDDIERMRDNE